MTMIIGKNILYYLFYALYIAHTVSHLKLRMVINVYKHLIIICRGLMNRWLKIKVPLFNSCSQYQKNIAYDIRNSKNQKF